MLMSNLQKRILLRSGALGGFYTWIQLDLFYFLRKKNEQAVGREIVGLWKQNAWEDGRGYFDYFC